MSNPRGSDPVAAEAVLRARLAAVIALCDRFDDDEFFAGYELAAGCRAAATGDMT